MVIAEDHIWYYPPNEYTQVQRLLKSIESTDIRIVSAITTILGDTIKRLNFEQAADLLILADPVRKNDTSDIEHQISDVNYERSEDNKKGSGYKGFKKFDKVSSVLELKYYSFK